MTYYYILVYIDRLNHIIFMSYIEYNNRYIPIAYTVHICRLIYTYPS